MPEDFVCRFSMITLMSLALIGLIIKLFRRRNDREEFKENEKEFFMRKHAERMNREDAHAKR